MRNHATIPEQFQSLFPSAPVSNLEVEKDKVYIIETLLKNATLPAWRWLVKNYTSHDIALVLRHARSLRKKDVILWSQYLHIPQEDIVCLQQKSPTGLSSSWVY